MRPVRILVVLMAAALAVGGCSDSDDKVEVATPAAPANATPTSAGEPEVGLDTRVPVDPTGLEVAVRCWGTESPTFLLETGHPGSGLDDFSDSAFADGLAARGTVCTYDRLGEGASDAPPDEKRTADDVVEVLHTVIDKSGMKAPLVLVGASFGGMVVTHYAATYPEDVAAVMLLEVPAPVAGLNFPELQWDHPSNTEKLDIVNGFEGRFADAKAPIAAPLLVVTATDGETDVEDQAVWLEISDAATQVEVPGGHDVAATSPEEVVAAIDAFLASR